MPPKSKYPTPLRVLRAIRRAKGLNIVEDRKFSEGASSIVERTSLSSDIKRLAPRVELTPPPKGISEVKDVSIVEDKKSPKGAASKVISDNDQVRGCVTALFSLLHVYGLQRSKTVDKAFERTVTHWQSQSSKLGPGGWLKFAKYKFAAFFFHHTVDCALYQLAPPPPPGVEDERPDLLATGVVYKFINLLMRDVTKKNTFLASILQVKKGCPRPTDDMVQSQVDKSREALTKEQKGMPDEKELRSWDEHPQDAFYKSPNDLTRASVIRELKRTVREIFEGKEYTDEYRHQPTFPSTSASYEDPRARGGAFASIRKFADAGAISTVGLKRVWDDDRKEFLEDENNTYITFEAVSLNSLAGELKISPREVTTNTLQEGLLSDMLRVTETLTESGYEYMVFGDTVVRPVVNMHDTIQDGFSLLDWKYFPPTEEGEKGKWVVDDTRLRERSKLLYERLLANAFYEPPLVTPVGLAESLKIRVITKGPPYSGFVMKPLQKFLWKTLKEHKSDVFTLIGEPVTAEFLQRKLGIILRDGELYLSGDYSAATDNLAPWVSEAIAEEISSVCNLRPEEAVIFRRLLTRHVFVDDDKRETPQRWGQLMGSVISFPVLCIANAAFCRWALELDYLREFSLTDCPLMVNGDDCAMKCTRIGLRMWQKITSYGGLTPSIGKFFASRTFVQINSENFERIDEGYRDIDRKSGKNMAFYFKSTPYVNLGLLYGLKRSGEVGQGDIGEGTNGIGVRCRELLSRAPEDVKSHLYDEFIRHHYKTLTSVKVPWYIPERYGGIGLPWLFEDQIISQGEEGSPETFRFERKVIRGAQKLDMQILTRIVSEPERYMPRKPPVDAPWDIYKFSKGRLPVKAVINPDVTSREREEYERVTHLMMIDAFFTCAEPMVQVEDLYKKALRHNERVWRKALRAQNLPGKPMSYDTMMKTSMMTEYVPAMVWTNKSGLTGDDILRDKEIKAKGLGKPRFGYVDTVSVSDSEGPWTYNHDALDLAW